MHIREKRKKNLGTWCMESFNMWEVYFRWGENSLTVFSQLDISIMEWNTIFALTRRRKVTTTLAVTHIYSRWKSAKVPKNGLWQAGAVTMKQNLLKALSLISSLSSSTSSLFTLRYFDLRHKLDFQRSTLTRLFV